MKTDKTKELENAIWNATHNQGTFGVFECTIGWFGNERVDYITYNTAGEFRCYEIKVSKSDFRSKSKNTFVGHYNYFVLTEELYEIVKDEIPKGVGVYVYNGTFAIQRKKPRKQELTVDKDVLKDSMIRSMCREIQKNQQSESLQHMNWLKRDLSEAKSDAKYYSKRWNEMRDMVLERFGRNWVDEPVKYSLSGRPIKHKCEIKPDCKFVGRDCLNCEDIKVIGAI